MLPQHTFQQWFQPFQDTLRHQAQRRWANVYTKGLLSPAHRKCIQPLAATVAPGKGDHLQHFITDSPWPTRHLEKLVAQHAQQLIGGKRAVLIIDDTCLEKFGTHSVGVARQYSGRAGKLTNCQCLVSLTLARDDIPIPLALRLFLPAEWTSDSRRCERAGVPQDQRRPKTKWEIALQELDRVRLDVTFDVVLADAGYGNNAEFRRALSRRGLVWSVGVLRIQKVYPCDVRLIPPPRIFRGRKPKYPTTTHDRQTVEELLGQAEWHAVVWRHGSKGALHGKFAACFVRLADGTENSVGAHLPGEEVWVIGEERANGERKYYACNLPPSAGLQDLVAVTKRRWACEHAHRELKQEVGLSQFEGRSWRGLHHHAVLCLVALLFLQWVRLSRSDSVPGLTVPAVRRLLVAVIPQLVACFRCRVCAALTSGP